MIKLISFHHYCEVLASLVGICLVSCSFVIRFSSIHMHGLHWKQRTSMHFRVTEFNLCFTKYKIGIVLTISLALSTYTSVIH